MRVGGAQDVIEFHRMVQMGTTDIGTPIIVWKLFCEPFASWKTTRGKEQFDQTTQQRYAEDLYQFIVRIEEVEGIDATMRITFRGMNLNIKSIRPAKADVLIEATLQDGVLGTPALMGYMETLPAIGAVDVPIEPFTIMVKGGTGPFVVSLTASALPAGLTLNGSTGVVSGTPLVTGIRDLNFRVTDQSDGTIDDLPVVRLIIA